ncbi:transposable element Tcb2 transposase [Trichonephila clavipes]|nr:transposable element Tcb2 transposase [Trichonephila clavipes]
MCSNRMECQPSDIKIYPPTGKNIKGDGYFDISNCPVVWGDYRRLGSIPLQSSFLVHGTTPNGGIDVWASRAADVMGTAILNVLPPGAFVWFEKAQGPLIAKKTRPSQTVSDRTASSRQLTAHWSTAAGVPMSASSIRRSLLHRELRPRVPLYRISLTANYRQNALMSTELGEQICTKFVFSDESNHASICGTMLTAFMLDAVPVNAAYQSALSNDIVA